MAKPEFFNHWKFHTLVARLRPMPAPHVYGHLEFVWHVGYGHGDPYLGTASALEAAAQWAGEPGALAAALLAARLIDEVAPGQYAIHDLYEHAPEYVRKRMDRRAGKQAAAAAQGQPALFGPDRPRPAPDGPGREKSSVLPHPHPLPEGEESPSPPLAHGLAAQGHEPTSPLAREGDPAAGEDGEGVVLTFETVGPEKAWGLTRERLRQWEQSYPDLDVLHECRSARQWTIDNPSRRKTARGMTRFLGEWLRRAQESGRGRPSGRPAEGRAARPGLREQAREALRRAGLTG